MNYVTLCMNYAGSSDSFTLLDYSQYQLLYAIYGGDR